MLALLQERKQCMYLSTFTIKKVWWIAEDCLLHVTDCFLYNLTFVAEICFVAIWAQLIVRLLKQQVR